ncbi:MAG: hypothetical protein LC798_10960 [Chloroflexi bacterium]|nr:hypothetical protein [Chloroflexota bacterium]
MTAVSITPNPATARVTVKLPDDALAALLTLIATERADGSEIAALLDELAAANDECRRVVRDNRSDIEWDQAVSRRAVALDELLDALPTGWEMHADAAAELAYALWTAANAAAPERWQRAAWSI